MSFSNQNIIFDDSTFTGIISWFKANSYSNIAVIVDENTFKYCYPTINVFPKHTLIKIKSGEEQKTLKTCEKIWSELTKYEFDRKGLVINLGGGVIGDMGGFCAATYKRGLKFIQIPTTLLSMVDASVGGKLGIDFKNFKNHIGVFQIPEAVIIYPGFINTLPFGEVRSGFAEVIKHCLIQDAKAWMEIKKITPTDLQNKKFDWHHWIKHSVAIKSKVVDKDPQESGLRKILNFGHTIGHAVESYFLEIPEKKLLHGEAIAIGMICESYLSMKTGNISEKDCKEISNYLISIYGKNKITKAEIDSIIPLTLQDKKNSNGKVKLALLNKIGECGYDFETNSKDMEESLHFYNQL
ncbi:MAG: 3-dehydroquinate synthase [Bacteroidota bacterium]|nr:3-dehydroquinate synthase [Bacteroidota bacterium]